MRSPRTELNLTEWVVLALASEAPTHGWTIVRALRRDGFLGDAWSSSGPLVYRAVARLQEIDLLRATGSEEGQGPNRVILETTPAGAEQVREWLTRPVDHVREMRTAFLVKLLLLEKRSADRRRLVERQRDALRPLAATLAERASLATGPNRPVAAWRAITADAVLRFLDTLDADDASRTGDPGHGVDLPDPSDEPARRGEDRAAGRP